MSAFLLRRGGWAVVTLLVFVSVVFFAVNLLVPWDHATTYWLQGGNPLVELVRETVGLNRPLWERYLDQMAGLFKGDLGHSFTGSSVTAVVTAALPTTLLVFGLGGVVAYLFGDWLGRVVAWRRGRLLSGATSTVSVGLYTAFPPLVVFLLVYVTAGPLADARSGAGLSADPTLMWAQSSASESQVTALLAAGVMAAVAIALAARAVARRRRWRLAAPVALGLAMLGVAGAVASLRVADQTMEVLLRATGIEAGRPGNPLVAALALALIAFGEVTMVVRAGITDELSEDYVTTAKAKGLTDREVRDRHVGRNAILPVMARMVTAVPYLLCGLIIIERELALPGLSSVFFEAIETVDVPMVIGILVAMGLLVLVLRLLLEVLHAGLDPRIRFAKGAS